MSKKILSVIAVILTLATLFSFTASAAEADWLDTNPKPPKDDYAYAFAVIGDHQMITMMDSGTSPEHDKTMQIPSEYRNQNYVKNMYKWILDNQESKKIKYVFNLGDVTENITDATEWNVAKEAIFQLNGKIPYSVARGNHDSPVNFGQVFKANDYLRQFNGFYTSVTDPTKACLNTYRLFSVGGVDYLFITYDYSATQDVVTWMGNLISSYPERKVIVTSHAALTAAGVISATCDRSQGVTGEQVWQELKKYENVHMILAGHVGSGNIGYKKITGDKGNEVFCFCINPQGIDLDEKPAGMIALFCFEEGGTRLNVQYYSTAQDKFYGTKNQMQIQIIKANLSTASYTKYVPETTAVSTDSTTVGDPTADSNGCGAFFLTSMAVLPVIGGCTAVAVTKKRKRR